MRCHANALSPLALFFCVSLACVPVMGNQTQPERSGTAAVPREWISFAVRPDVDLATLRYIARVSKPLTETLVTSETLQHLLRRHYGSSHFKLRTLFHEFNPKLKKDPISARTTVVLPAAPWWEFNKTKKIRDDSTLLDEATIQMGFSGPKTRKAVRRANPGARFDTHGSAILPYMARVRSYELRPEFAGHAKEIAKRLNVRSGIAHGAGPAMTLAPELETVAPDASCINPQEDLWPVPELTPAHAAYLTSSHNSAVVAILDSGLPDLEDKRLVLWKNRIEANGIPGVDDDGNNLVDDIYGYDFAESRSMPIDDLVDDTGLHGHGLHVVGIASGRLSPEASIPDLDSRMQLMILKVADRLGDVMTQAVTDAIAYADDHDTNVVNLSLAGIESSVEPAISTRKRMLFVVAAGNGNFKHVGMNVDRVSVYPAQLSKTYPNVIAVAAENVDGTIACFSNYGVQTVDVAAPGVKVASLSRSGESVRMTGTSQATPLVTLVASLLYSLGVRSPAEIKRRIISTVDYDPALASSLTSGGRLNIEKALSVDSDVVELRGPEHVILRGTVRNLTKLTLTQPNRTIPFRSVQKIVPSDGAGTYRVSWIDHGITKVVFGRLDGEFNLSMRDGTQKTIAFRDVVDLIPSFLQ